jgi:hypothetical protein
MKYFLLLLTILFWNVAVSQSTQTTEQIRQQMAKIRQTTNWDDPVAAKKANEQIKELAKKLMMNGSTSGNSSNQQQQGSGSQSKDAQKLNELNQEMIDQKMDLWSQIWKSAAGGKGADILLAEPLRDEIVQEFKDDETPSSGGEMAMEETTLLFLDLSSNLVKLTIDQMENYKSINTLIITGGKNGAPVDLNDLLRRAKNYPLEILYIINFRQFVKSIPESIGQYKKLRELGLFNNNLDNLPAGIGMLTSLKNFYVDINPIKTLGPTVNSLSGLDTLGVAKTNISQAEVNKINRLLPNCKILK